MRRSWTCHVTGLRKQFATHAGWLPVDLVPIVVEYAASVLQIQEYRLLRTFLVNRYDSPMATGSLKSYITAHELRKLSETNQILLATNDSFAVIACYNPVTRYIQCEAVGICDQTFYRSRHSFRLKSSQQQCKKIGKVARLGLISLSRDQFILISGEYVYRLDIHESDQDQDRFVLLDRATAQCTLNRPNMEENEPAKPCTCFPDCKVIVIHRRGIPVWTLSIRKSFPDLMSLHRVE
jgi:hypothetical protein